MKVAYLASLYPAPSHTFIQREILGLEALGLQPLRFSVRTVKQQDVLDPLMASEAAKTRSLIGAPVLQLLSAFFWMVTTRPVLASQLLWDAVSKPTTWFLRLKWVAYFGEAMLLSHWLERDGADHLHCHFGNAGSNVGWLAARLSRLPFSLTFHGIDLDEPELFRHRDKLRDAVFAVCISAFGGEQLKTAIDRGDWSKVSVIRCGFPVPPESEVTPLPGRNQIICVARLSPEKGHAVLIEALAILAAQGVAFDCALIGDGPLGEDIKHQVRDASLTDRVRFLGSLSHAEVLRALVQADVSVLASFGEGIPVALLEALAFKRPVVATSVGGVPELVLDGQTGRLVPPKDAQALAAAISWLFDNPDEGRQLGQAGHDLVRDKHDPDLAAARLKALFETAR